MNKIDKTCWSTQKPVQTSSTRINMLGWAWPKERCHQRLCRTLPNAFESTFYLVYTYKSEAKPYTSTVLQSTIHLIHSTLSRQYYSNTIILQNSNQAFFGATFTCFFLDYYCIKLRLYYDWSLRVFSCILSWILMNRLVLKILLTQHFSLFSSYGPHIRGTEQLAIIDKWSESRQLCVFSWIVPYSQTMLYTGRQEMDYHLTIR